MHWLLASGGWWYWHPLATGHGTTCSAVDHTGCGYSLWSGFIGDLGLVTIFVSIAVFLAAWWRKHNCHVHHCPRISWHPHPEHGHPVCRVHHPSGQGRGNHLAASEYTLDRHLEILAKRHPDPPPPTMIRPPRPPGDPSNRSA